MSKRPAPKSPVAIVLSLDAARDALDRAADAVRQRYHLGCSPSSVDERILATSPWSALPRATRQTWRHAVADAVEALGDPATAARLRELIALLEATP